MSCQQLQILSPKPCELMSTAPDIQKCIDSLSLLTLVRFEPAVSSDGSGMAKRMAFENAILKKCQKASYHPYCHSTFAPFSTVRKIIWGETQKSKCKWMQQEHGVLFYETWRENCEARCVLAARSVQGPVSDNTVKQFCIVKLHWGWAR